MFLLGDHLKNILRKSVLRSSYMYPVLPALDTSERVKLVCWKQVRVPSMQQAVHAVRPPRQARQDPQRQRKQERKLRLVLRLRGQLAIRAARRSELPSRLHQPHTSATHSARSGLGRKASWPRVSQVGSGAVLSVSPLALGPHPFITTTGGSGRIKL